ncbi:MAG: hypothetical protein ABIG71_00910 [Candidatus Uhrbacteria bacterium]
MRHDALGVVARIRDGAEALAEELRALGLRAHAANSGIFVELAERGDGNYPIPDAIRKHRPDCYLSVAEHGGAFTGATGYGVIVCSFGGQPLRAHHIEEGGRGGCGIHARFSTGNGAYTIEAGLGSDEIVITKHRVSKLGGNVAKLISKVFFAGDVPTTAWTCNVCGTRLDHAPSPKELSAHARTCHGRFHHAAVTLPKAIEFLRDPAAIIAAKNKAQCGNCRCVHYAIRDRRAPAQLPSMTIEERDAA